MISHERLQKVASEVSFGRFKPAMSIEVTTKTTSEGEFPAILIGIDAYDATELDNATEAPDSIRLYECHRAPDLDDRALANWIRERCQDIILHEMDEFFRWRGEPVIMPKHPVSDEVFVHVRQRVYG